MNGIRAQPNHQWLILSKQKNEESSKGVGTRMIIFKLKRIQPVCWMLVCYKVNSHQVCLWQVFYFQRSAAAPSLLLSTMRRDAFEMSPQLLPDSLSSSILYYYPFSQKTFYYYSCFDEKYTSSSEIFL